MKKKRKGSALSRVRGAAQRYTIRPISGGGEAAYVVVDKKVIGSIQRVYPSDSDTTVISAKALPWRWYVEGWVGMGRVGGRTKTRALAIRHVLENQAYAPGLPQWAWMVDGDDEAYGPYETRDVALRAARSKLKDGQSFSLGHAIYPDPAKFVVRGNASRDVGYLLDEMTERATEDGIYAGDKLFAVNMGGASEAYREALAAWAKQWVKVVSFTFEAVPGESFTVGK